MSTTAEVLERHMKALGAGDLAGIMDDYADDAVMVSGAEPTRGKAAIESFFSMVTANGPAEFNRDVTVIEGDYAYITWHNDMIAFGTDTFVIRDGKIVFQTVGFTEQTEKEMVAAIERALGASASTGTTAVVAK